MRFVFATWPIEYQGMVLTSAGANDRLISFAFLRSKPAGYLEEYLENGYVLSEDTKALAMFLAPNGTGPR